MTGGMTRDQIAVRTRENIRRRPVAARTSIRTQRM